MALKPSSVLGSPPAGTVLPHTMGVKKRDNILSAKKEEIKERVAALNTKGTSSSMNTNNVNSSINNSHNVVAKSISEGIGSQIVHSTPVRAKSADGNIYANNYTHIIIIVLIPTLKVFVDNLLLQIKLVQHQRLHLVEMLGIVIIPILLMLK